MASDKHFSECSFSLGYVVMLLVCKLFCLNVFRQYVIRAFCTAMFTLRKLFMQCTIDFGGFLFCTRHLHIIIDDEDDEIDYFTVR